MNRQKARFGGPFCLPVRQRQSSCCPCLRESRARLPAACSSLPGRQRAQTCPPAPHGLPLRCADRHISIPLYGLPCCRSRGGGCPSLCTGVTAQAQTDQPSDGASAEYVLFPDAYVVCQENRAHLSLFKGRRHFRMLLATQCRFSQHTSRGSLGQCCCPAAGQYRSAAMQKKRCSAAGSRQRFSLPPGGMPRTRQAAKRGASCDAPPWSILGGFPAAD